MGEGETCRRAYSLSLFLFYSWLVHSTVRVPFNTCNFMQVHVHAADDTLTIDARDVEEEGQDYSLSR